jgi:hypothetical protein
MTYLKLAAAAFGLSAAVLAIMAAVPASAAPAANAAVLKAAVADDLVSVAAKKKTKKWRRGYYYDDAGAWYGGPDTVGSVGYDGWGYGYNRFSGQRYSSCVEDLGYGRVRPCDAGRR